MYRKWVIALLVIFMMPLSAQSEVTYYLSSSSGNDANDGLSEATAWQTLEKLNSVKMADNSTVLFKRGDTFRGEVSLIKAPKGITFSAYGTGDNPILAGSLEVKNWVPTTHSALSTTIYEADVSALPLTEDGIYHLFVNDELMVIARYPNVKSPAERNWLNIDSSAGKNTLVDSALVAYGKQDGYWTGATLRVRSNSWYYNARQITGYSATEGKITFKNTGGADSDLTLLADWGYFLDGKLEELDNPGEWFYDSVAKKVYLYPPAGTDPNKSLVEVSTYDIGLSVFQGESNAVVENLAFKHFITKCLSLHTSDNITVRNNFFNYCNAGISTYVANDFLLSNNTITNSLTMGIGLTGKSGTSVGNSVLEKNKIINTGMFAIYGRRWEGPDQGIGIKISSGKGYQLRQNTIENTCYTGIEMLEGENVLENNVIRKSLMILNDGGAITLRSGKNIIRGNLILDSYGNVDESNGRARAGADAGFHSSYGMGIFFYSAMNDNVIENNTIANNRDRGVFVDSSNNTIIRNNVIYNNRVQVELLGKNSGNRVEGNIMYALTPKQQGVNLTNETTNPTFSGNYYCNPYYKTLIVGEGGLERYSIPHWQSAFPNYDQDSKECSFNFIEYTSTPVGENIVANSRLDSNDDGWSGGDFDPNKIDGGSFKAVQKVGEKNFASYGKFKLEKDQWYRLTFEAIADGFFNESISVNDDNPANRSGIVSRYFGFDQTRRQYEFVFQSTLTTEYGRFQLLTRNSHGGTVYWLDNLIIEPVEAVLNDPTQKSILFTNDTDVPKTFQLGGAKYLNLEQQEVTGSVTLPAFSSQILVCAECESPKPPETIKIVENASNMEFLGGIAYSLRADGMMEFYENDQKRSVRLEDFLGLGFTPPAAGFTGEITGLLYMTQGDTVLPADSLIAIDSTNKAYWWAPTGNSGVFDLKTVNINRLDALFSIPGATNETIAYLEGNDVVIYSTGARFSLQSLGFPSTEAVKAISRDEVGAVYYLVTESGTVYVYNTLKSEWQKQ